MGLGGLAGAPGSEPGTPDPVTSRSRRCSLADRPFDPLSAALDATSDSVGVHRAVLGDDGRFADALIVLVNRSGRDRLFPGMSADDLRGVRLFVVRPSVRPLPLDNCLRVADGGEAVRTFGLTVESRVGTPLARLVPEAHRPEHRGRMAAFPSGEAGPPGGVGTRVMALRADGTEFAAEITLSARERGGERCATRCPTAACSRSGWSGSATCLA